MVETRGAPRYRVWKPARIGTGKSAIHCMLHDLSISGAAIEVESQANVTDRFVIFVAEYDLHLPCSVVWRKAYRVGVAFDW